MVVMQKLFVHVRRFVKGFGPVWYHIGLVSMSATIAMLLPYVGQGLLSYWELAKNQKFLIVTAEILVAVLLIVFFNHLCQSLAFKKLANVASGAGLVYFFPAGGRLAQKKITHLRQEHGSPRNVMIIGSTGRTFVDPQGDSYAVLRNCLEARIMLLNPCSENAKVRATSILHPEVTLDTLKAQATQPPMILNRTSD